MVTLRGLSLFTSMDVDSERNLRGATDTLNFGLGKIYRKENHHSTKNTEESKPSGDANKPASL